MLENLPLFSAQIWIVAICVAVFAGFVKGIVGFALPLIMVSGLGSVMAPELALAGLIFSTVVTNIMQAFRQGVRSVATSVVKFRWFLLSGGVLLVLGAQLVPILPERAYLLSLGIPIVLYILSQFLGWRLPVATQSVRFDCTIGSIAGFFGGIAGVWGPPTVAYLTALNAHKSVQMQVQGVIYLSGAIVLAGAHVVSGILTAETTLFSLSLVAPAVFGMWLGTRVQDRINQAQFRQATLMVLLVAGLNLIRRALVV